MTLFVAFILFNEDAMLVTHKVSAFPSCIGLQFRKVWNSFINHLSNRNSCKIIPIFTDNKLTAYFLGHSVYTSVSNIVYIRLIIRQIWPVCLVNILWRLITRIGWICTWFVHLPTTVLKVCQNKIRNIKNCFFFYYSEIPYKLARATATCWYTAVAAAQRKSHA